MTEQRPPLPPFTRDSAIQKVRAAEVLDTVTVIGAGGETPEPVPGDVNGSGTIETADALLVLRYMLGVETLTEEQLAAADFDGSGTVEQADALLILRAALGIGA